MTFTILARDPSTGRLGGATTTSDLAVGARVLFAAAGVGVVATQHRTDPRLGSRVLEALRGGGPPPPPGGAGGGAPPPPPRPWRGAVSWETLEPSATRPVRRD
jgi:hypothetical protein